jgi:hypothetical protein
LGTPAGSNEILHVPLPEDFNALQVEVSYSYYNKHHVRLEFGQWVFRNRYQSEFLWRPLEFAEPLLEKIFPEPDMLWSAASTGWLTNQPSDEKIK